MHSPLVYYLKVGHIDGLAYEICIVYNENEGHEFLMNLGLASVYICELEGHISIVERGNLKSMGVISWIISRMIIKYN